MTKIGNCKSNDNIGAGLMLSETVGHLRGHLRAPLPNPRLFFTFDCGPCPGTVGPVLGLWVLSWDCGYCPGTVPHSRSSWGPFQEP